MKLTLPFALIRKIYQVSELIRKASAIAENRRRRDLRRRPHYPIPPIPSDVIDRTTGTFTRSSGVLNNRLSSPEDATLRRLAPVRTHSQNLTQLVIETPYTPRNPQSGSPEINDRPRNAYGNALGRRNSSQFPPLG